MSVSEVLTQYFRDMQRSASSALGRNQGFIQQLGVDEDIDYEALNFEDIVSDVDIVLDTQGGDTLTLMASAEKVELWFPVLIRRRQRKRRSTR